MPGPNKFVFRNAIQRALAQYKDDRVKQGEAAFKIAWKTIEMALSGNLSAIKELCDRMDGKAAQALSLQDSQGNDITSQITDLELARRWAFLAEQAARAKEEEETRH